jgi:pyruvate kinase
MNLQLVATIGPSSLSLVDRLATEGATVFRLNASHMDPPEVEATVELLRRAAPGLPIVIDLQGAKMRLGRFEPRRVVTGDRVAFAHSPSSSKEIPLPHPQLFRQVAEGETIGSDDDRLRFRIESVSHAGWLEAVAERDGVLRPRKGVNLLEHPVELDGLTERDQDICRTVRPRRGITWAFSFMKDGREAAWLRSLVSDAAIVGKIERREAAEAVEAIAAVVDAVWICRGDLGAQLGDAALAAWVGSFAPRTLKCPVLMAGQVLEHLTAHAEATRSEICHLYDLVRRGYAGIVLSDETAIGADPARAVRVAAALMRGFERETDSER